MKSSSKDLVEITLIINDTTSTKIQLNISKANDELISHLCNDLTQRFNLNEKTKHKLFNHISKELSNIQANREKKQEIENQRSKHFDHLYYYYTLKKQEREEYYKKLHQENLTKEISQCSFSPSINIKSSQLYKRDYQRIEDKLYRDAKVLGNKRLNRMKKNDSICHTEGDIINIAGNNKGNVSVNKNKNVKKNRNLNGNRIGKEENKEKDLKVIQNSIINNNNDNKAIVNERVNIQTSPMPSNEKQRRPSPKTQESYVDKYKHQRNSFHKHTVQGNTDYNTNYNNNNDNNNTPNHKQIAMNPTRKHTANNRRINLSLENDQQQLFTTRVSKKNSNKAIQSIDYDNTNTNKSLHKNKSKAKDITQSPSFSFIITNNNNHNKSSSSNQKDWITRKGKSQSKLTIQKESEMNRMYQAIYPFKPEISKSSRAMILKKGKENKDSLFKRLSETKQYHSVLNALNDLQPIHTSQQVLNTNNTHNNSASIRNTPSDSKAKMMIVRQKTNQIKTEPNCDTVITTNPQSTSFTTERKKKPTEFKQEREIIQSMKEMELKENNNKKHYKNQYVTNLEKFKLNQLKEIYEILTRNGNEIDLEALIANGVPLHIKEKVIVPTCYKINNKNLEFNFQNFYMIASEILSKYF